MKNFSKYQYLITILLIISYFLILPSYQAEGLSVFFIHINNLITLNSSVGGGTGGGMSGGGGGSGGGSGGGMSGSGGGINVSNPMNAPDISPNYKWEVGVPGFSKKDDTTALSDFPILIQALLKWVFRVAGLLVFSMIVFGGFQYMVSGGNTQIQKAAQEKIINAIIGLLLLFVSWLIINTINPDILRAPQGINITPSGPTISGPTTSGAIPLGPTPTGPTPTVIHSQKAKDIARKLINNGYGGTTQIWKAAISDLTDVINDKCTDPINNSTNPNGNCLSKVSFSNCPTVQDNLLIAIDGILDKYGKTNGPQYCGPLIISPFISDHYYCEVPTSSHKNGKAVDISCGSGSNEKECIKILSRIITGLSGELEEGKVYSTTINNIGLLVIKEIASAVTGQPHLHVQLP